jgi:heat shock protein HslJ
MTPIRVPAALILLAMASLAPAAPEAQPTTAGTGPAAGAEPAPAPAPESAAPIAAPRVPSPVFEGLTWQLGAYRSGDALVEPEKGHGPALFKFERGRLAGSPGCNRLMGAYTLDGDRLVFKPQMAATMMACPEPLMAQDQAVSEAFGAVARVRLEGGMLELLDAAGAPVLRFLRLQSSPLVGPVWELEGYNNGKQAMVSALAGTRITLELRDDGTLGGFDGCNRFMSGYTLEEGKLAIGPLATTRMACRGPQGAAQQASAFAAALATVGGYRVEGGELTLLDAQGEVAARFRAASDPAAEASRPRPAAPAASVPATVQPR